MSLQLSYQVGLQGREFLGRPTRNRFDVHCSGFPSLLQVAFDRGSGHAKQFDDVSALVALIDGSQHSFSQILRIRFHWLPPIDACLLLVSPFILSLGSRLLPTAVGYFIGRDWGSRNLNWLVQPGRLHVIPANR